MSKITEKQIQAYHDLKKAISEGNASRIRTLLLKPEANVNLTIDNGLETLLMHAVLIGQRGMASILLECGANLEATNLEGNTALMLAAAKGSRPIVELLVNKGAKLNTLNNVGFSALSHAAFMGNAQVVRFLVDRNADIDASSCLLGNTPFDHADHKGFEDIARFLVENGARVPLLSRFKYSDSIKIYNNSKLSQEKSGGWVSTICCLRRSGVNAGHKSI